MSAVLLGMRTTIFKVADLGKAKAWYAKAFGIVPYFDEPFYVGYNVGGFELGLDPDTSDSKPGAGGSTTYWGVANLDATMHQLEALKVVVHSPARDVGEGIKVAAVEDPFGNVIGLIENPHFGKALSS